MLLIAGAIFGSILLIATLFFALKIFSVTLFHIPGFDFFFQYIIILIPYILFFAAYYYLVRKIKNARSKASRIIAGVLLLAGLVTCIFTLILSTVLFLQLKIAWMIKLEDYTHYALITQLLFLFISAGVLASGDTREVDWMKRNTTHR